MLCVMGTPYILYYSDVCCRYPCQMTFVKHQQSSSENTQGDSYRIKLYTTAQGILQANGCRTECGTFPIYLSLLKLSVCALSCQLMRLGQHYKISRAPVLITNSISSRDFSRHTNYSHAQLWKMSEVMLSDNFSFLPLVQRDHTATVTVTFKPLL